MASQRPVKRSQVLCLTCATKLLTNMGKSYGHIFGTVTFETTPAMQQCKTCGRYPSTDRHVKATIVNALVQDEIEDETLIPF